MRFLRRVLLIATTAVVVLGWANAASAVSARSAVQADRLSAGWWNWAAGQPEATSPLVGAPCDVAQSGHVWFLGGAPTSTGPVTRSCEVPVGKTLLMPVVNGECSLAEDQGPTVQDLRACAVGQVENFSGSATIDGRELPILKITSAPFPLTFAPGNVFEVTAGDTTSVASGYWVELPPLKPGTHVLHVAGSVGGGTFTQDVTYVLTVTTPAGR